VGDLLRPAAARTKPIAGPAAAQRPGKRRLRHVDFHSFSGAARNLQDPCRRLVTAGRRDRYLGRPRMRWTAALELDHRPPTGDVERAFTAVEQTEDRFQVLALGAKTGVIGGEEQGAPLQRGVPVGAALRQRVEERSEERRVGKEWRCGWWAVD